jgi:hypothetical protein
MKKIILCSTRRKKRVPILNKKLKSGDQIPLKKTEHHQTKVATTRIKMKKAKSLMLIAILAITVSTSLTSCLMTKTNVGAYQETQGNEYTYGKGKQIWLFWGLVPIGRTSVSTPGDGVCQVITKFNLGDVLIYGFTGGFVTTYTIKVKAKKKQ